MEKKIDIGGELHSVATDHKVADASEIKDISKGNKSQTDFNNDVDRHEIEIYGTGGINSRLTDVEQMEQIVLDGGEVQIAQGSDFTNPDAAKRAKVPTVGAIVDGLNDGIYDVSKRNPTGGPNSDGKFTLDYILDNANTLIPISWRHGGMSIKFVQSSDNNYKRFDLIADEFTTDTTQWQGVDDEPTAGSKNLVESGGAALMIKKTEGYFVYDSFVKNNNTNLSYKIQDLRHDVPLFLKVTTDANIGGAQLFYYNSSEEQISSEVVNKGEWKTLNIPENAVSMRIYNGNSSNTNGTYLIELKTLSYDQKIEETKEELQNNLNVSKVPTYKFFLNEEEQTKILTGVVAVYALKDFSEDSKEYYLYLCGYRNSAPGQSYLIVQDGNGGTVESKSFDASTNGLKAIDCAGFRFIIDKQKLPNNSTGAFIDYHLHINKWAIPFINIEHYDEVLDALAENVSEVSDTLEYKADKENLFHHTVNLFDGEIIPNSWILSTTGEVSARAGNFVTKNLIPVEYGKEYHFSRFNGTIRRENDNYFCEFDTNGDPIITETLLKGASYKVTSQNVKYIKVTFVVSSGQTAESTKAMVYEWDARAMWMSDPHSDFYFYQTAYQEYGYEKVLPLAYSRKGRKMVCFGDSITDFGFYPEYAGYILEMGVVNMGFGGTRITNTADNVNYRALCMYELVQAIIAGDFTDQIAAASALATEHPTWYDKITTLSGIDFNNIDVITIEYGVNDFSGGVPIGEDTDTTPTTIKGAMNLIIEQIKTNYPKIQVVIIPPMYRRYGDNNETDSDSYIINTKKLPDVVEAEESVARLNHCEYLELYWTLGVNKYNWQTFLADSTHPNNIGYVEIGRRLAGYLASH